MTGSFSYANIARGGRISKLVIIQKKYRDHLVYLRCIKLMLRIKLNIAASLIAACYLKFKHRCYLKTRENIPSLPLEVWDLIFSFMERIHSVPHRQLAKEYASRYPSRLVGPTCGICKQEAFIPVSLRFGWTGDASELCSHEDNKYCLRCARDHFSQWRLSNRLKCPHGCCDVPKPYGLKPFMAYGDWPRRGADVPHPALYAQMDKQGIGLTTCRRCFKNCNSITCAVQHVRTVCRREKDNF